MPLIIEFMVHSMLFGSYYHSFDGGLFADLLDIEFDEHDEFSFEVISEKVETSPERVLLMAAYAYCGDNSRKRYYDWRGEYTGNEDLDWIYDMLEKFGYQVSDEEQALRDGTHELFAQDDEDIE